MDWPTAVWTGGLALLPLGFTLAGFHAWRRACPLAWFGQLGRHLGRPGKRKAGERLDRVYPLIQLGLLGGAMAARLAGVDGSPVAIAGMLAGIFLFAAAVSFLYTGKTWCNYFCPVGIVEKLTSEPVHLVPQRNAQCTPCTACKRNCHRRTPWRSGCRREECLADSFRISRTCPFIFVAATRVSDRWSRVACPHSLPAILSHGSRKAVDGASWQPGSPRKRIRSPHA